MRLFGYEFSLGAKSSGDSISIDTLIRRLEALYETASGVAVTPESCMQSPTVQAIVTAVSRRVASMPVHVYSKKTGTNGRTYKEALPNHPVARLLARPNEWQTPTSYWLDATSWLMRYGNFVAYKSRGQTGPIRALLPLVPSAVDMVQDDTSLEVTYRVRKANGRIDDYAIEKMHHARGAARNGLWGDSTVMDIRDAIALEIAAERMGASFIGNGAMPSLVFKYAAGSAGHRSDEERKRFLDSFHSAYSGKGRFKAMLLPKGIETDKPVEADYEKAQVIETRAYQRTVIAGAFGVPPHLVGDLTKMTFGNVEQQSLDFVNSVVLPYCRVFESAMERDLLTREDRINGVIIRFNLDAVLRGDFKSRQEGLKIQREAGVISPNDWREHENMNPIAPEDGGDTYWQQGPSGQNGAAAGEDAGGTDSEADDADAAA